MSGSDPSESRVRVGINGVCPSALQVSFFCMGNILIGLKDSFNGAREEKDFTGELGDTVVRFA